MTRRITNDEYLALALRYNEQRTINDSLQKEITELKEKNEIWGRYVRECMTEMDELKDRLDEFAVVAEMNTLTSADEWNNRNRIS